MHWALEGARNENRARAAGGPAHHAAAGPRPSSRIQINEYVHIGFAPADNAQGTIFYGLTGLHGAHVFVGLTLLAVRHDPRLPRPLHGQGAPRRRGAGHLLALRRRHVDRRLHDDLHPLARDQPAALRAGGVPVPALRGRGRRPWSWPSSSSCGRSEPLRAADLELAERAARAAGRAAAGALRGPGPRRGAQVLAHRHGLRRRPRRRGG